MTVEYLKKAPLHSRSDAGETRDIVGKILDEIEAGGDEKALEYAAKFDNYQGAILLSAEAIKTASALVPDKMKRDIEFAHANVKKFAEVQKSTVADFETEVVPGLIAGQKAIPVNAAGCYIPGGRYSHVASAIMTVTTAKVAGCKNIIACSPPRPDIGVAPAIIYAAHISGADKILAMGGVQGVAAMTFGLFGLPKANILVGPGNQFVAEAKRMLFGRIGIDMIAGPTDSLILADAHADADIVAADLVGQAEHGYNSPVWLVTDDRALAEKVMLLVPALIEDLPELNRDNAYAAWRDYAEIVLCDTREEMAATSDAYAPEHLTVQAQDLDWWLSRITRRLERLGATVFLGQRAENLAGAEVIVVSTAIKPGNPELDEARKAGFPVVRRAEMLAELMRLKSNVAVAGTHGKTTTTTMVSTLLHAGGFDPTVVNGGVIHAFESNARTGQGEWMVVEADESDGTFNRLPATIAVVTNIDPEHMEEVVLAAGTKIQNKM